LFGSLELGIFYIQRINYNLGILVVLFKVFEGHNTIIRLKRPRHAAMLIDILRLSFFQ